MAIPIAEAPYRIQVRNSALIKQGEIARLTSMTVIPKFNAVGSFEITIPADDPKSSLLMQGSWITFLTANDSELMSGSIRGIKEVWDESNPFGGMLTIYGPSAEQVIADRLAYQVPTSAATAQSSKEYDSRSGVGETVIKDYVNLNAGPGALAARRTAGLVVEPNQLRGTSVKASARMDNLLDLIAPLAQTAGLGFRVAFNAAGQLEFRMYVPEDRSAFAKFGKGLGNLVSFERTREASKSSAVVVGGSGDGTARVFREIVDTDAVSEWDSRSETFVDRRDSTDTDELDQSATEETVTNGPVTGLAIKTTDTPNLMFYRDYFLGDIVSIPDAGITDILREVNLTWGADNGSVAETTVGTSSVTGTRRMVSKLDQLNARVAALEAKK